MLRASFLAPLLAGLPLLAACGDDAPSSTNDPKILSFTADGQTALTIDAGAQVTLAWEVDDNSTSLAITGGGTTVVESADATGSVETSAIFAETTFTLTASGREGTTPATRSITVAVNGANDVQIRSFTANPTEIDLDQTATLEFETSNATSVSIQEVNIGPLDLMGQLSGQVTVMPRGNQPYLLTAEGPGGPKTAMVQVSVLGAPNVTSFMANPSTIDQGQSAMLEWVVTDIDSITINDGQNDIHMNTNTSGSFRVSPLQTTTYEIVAVKQGFSPFRATTMVTVNAGTGARIVSFTANPQTIDFGQTSDLTWEVENAPEGIEIRVNNLTATSSMDLNGTFSVSPNMTTTYTLVAKNAGQGDNMAMAPVTVNPTPPSIQSFVAQPNPGPLGGQSVLSWDIVGATAVRVLEDGVEIPTSGQLNTGAIIITSTAAAQTTYILEATNPNGMDMATETVTWIQPAEINDFQVSPLTFTGASAMVTVTWDTSNADSVALEANGVAVPGFVSTTLVGSFMFQVTGTTDIQFSAIKSGLPTIARARVIQILDIKVEPNDTSTQATAIPADGTGVLGELSDASDVDFYEFTVPAGGWVRAETTEPAGDCPSHDTVLVLYDSQLNVLVTDLDDGIRFCSLIDPTVDAGAGNLAGGTYFLAVESEFGGAGPYVLVVETGLPACGNGILESGEQCDDGNLLPGDGCGVSCNVQVSGVVDALDFGTPQIFSAGLPQSGQLWYQVTLPSDGYIRVETFSPTAPDCDTDTVVSLFDGANLLGSDDFDGVNSCSLIDPARDAFAAVGPGTYNVQVRHDSGAPIPAIEVHILTTGQGCGNGILESGPPLNETCDDGNGASGDGCDASCQFEGAGETEPNDLITDTGVQVLTATQAYLAGEINPATDQDLWAIDVPEGWHLEAFVTIGGPNVCPSGGPTGRVAVLDDAGAEIVSDAFGGVDGNCGFIGPNDDAEVNGMTAGRYYIAVTESGGNETIPGYFLQVRLIAPGCGNLVFDTGEQCEDGNAMSGDGCDLTCKLEIVTTFQAPGGTASLTLPTDVSFQGVHVVVAAGQAITATISDGAGGCPLDTTLELFQVLPNNGGFAGLGSRSAGGPGGCPSIKYPGDAFARDLEAGTYYLRALNDETMGGTVQLDVGILDAQCGNARQESNAGEQCDDGNTTASDGCSPTCTLEPDLIYNVPADGRQVFNGRSLVQGDQDVIRVQVTGNNAQYLLPETYDDSASMSCTTFDGLMNLFESDGTTLLGSDSGFAAPYCPAFALPGSTFARLEPGTYFLTVSDFFQGAVQSYDLILDAQPADICGNMILEPGEQCDDGNVAGGDGCDANCMPESAIVPEIEPNADATMATDTTLSGAGTVRLSGVIDVGADQDYWSFTVPAGANLDLRAHTFPDAANPTSSCGPYISGGTAPLDPELFLLDATGAVLQNNDDISSTNICAEVTDNLAPGTYYLRVEYWSNPSDPPNGAQTYYMQVQLTP